MNTLHWLLRTGLATFFALALILLFVWQQDRITVAWRRPKTTVPPIFRQSSTKPSSDLHGVACKGARGLRLDDQDSYDLPRSLESLPNSNITFPVPTLGSYDEVGLEKSWMSFEQRYGPYGYGEQTRFGGEVDWRGVDWGALQAECLRENQHTFGAGAAKQSVGENRFRLHNESNDPMPSPPPSRTGRHAIVLRSWSTYKYHDEDFWNLRSIITEAGLATHGKYSVILLVDVKCEESCETIHTDEKEYQRVLEESVPEEFRSMAVLFHPSLQKSWYPKVDEYKPFWQIMQPLQLLAHFYAEFDFYWQFEMDTRFTGDVGKMLEAFDGFGREQPVKQAVERASFGFIPKIHGSFREFTAGVNKAVRGGGSSIWGPVKVKNLEPIGPTPPMKAQDDTAFSWRVGEQADLLVLGQLNDARKGNWPFKGWRRGDFGKGFENLPRYSSVPAQARASWELLEGIHRAQHDHGLAVHSEATLPSFAVWLGLKIVSVPMPRFQFPERDILELSYVMNGQGYGNGVARGVPGVTFFIRPMTWAWWSSLCDPVFIRWMGGQPEHYKGDSHEAEHNDPNYVGVPNEVPGFMKEVEGTIYMPGVVLHPRKSDHYRAPE